jgi:hypothetical protein
VQSQALLKPGDSAQGLSKVCTPPAMLQLSGSGPHAAGCYRHFANPGLQHMTLGRAMQGPWQLPFSRVLLYTPGLRSAAKQRLSQLSNHIQWSSITYGRMLSTKVIPPSGITMLTSAGPSLSMQFTAAGGRYSRFSCPASHSFFGSDVWFCDHQGRSTAVVHELSSARGRSTS